MVEVLEAVQLLLNTKLFILILGFDTRYVTRALEKEYKEILQHEGNPSGLDYIEKIIQIPYRVRAIDKDALRKYIEKQMDIEKAPEQKPVTADVPLTQTAESQEAQNQSGDKQSVQGQPVQSQPIQNQQDQSAQTQLVETQPAQSQQIQDQSIKDQPEKIQPSPVQGQSAQASQSNTSQPQAIEILSASQVVPEQSSALSVQVQENISFQGGMAPKSHEEVKLPEIELPAAVIQFKQEDLDDLAVCCHRVVLTPRSIKRLVNVFKLMKIFWFRADKNAGLEERDRPRRVKQAAMILLALSSAYPEVMREVFVHLDTLYRQGQEDTNLFTALSNIKLPPGSASELSWQLQKYKTDVNSFRSISGNGQDQFGQLALRELKLSTFNIVRSFSFVGDPVFWTDGGENVSESNRSESQRVIK